MSTDYGAAKVLYVGVAAFLVCIYLFGPAPLLSLLLFIGGYELLRRSLQENLKRGRTRPWPLHRRR